jgi:hypothetical protein
MEFVCYTSWDQLPDTVDSLLAQTAKESLFFSRPWFENLSKNAPEDRRNILLACVEADGKVLALLPLEMRSREHWYGLTNLYSSLYTLLLAEDNQQAILECLARGLIQRSFSSLRLEPIAEDDRNMLAFQQTMTSLGVACHRTFRFYNWIHHTQGETFDGYMASRPARVRNTIARKSRKLEREHGYTIRLFCDSDIEQGLQDYHTVYNRSWKANELYGEFIEGLARNLSVEGWLRLAILYTAERPIAAQFWFVVHGKASIFKLAYDKEWRDYSPGSILTRYLMQQVIDSDKVHEIDFLTGNDAYKQEWMSERRKRWALYCINKPEPVSRMHRLSKWFHALLRQRN